MQKRSSNRDDFQNALRVVEEAIGGALAPHKKNRAAVTLGRRGGLKGGPARAKALTPEQRKDIARNAAKARWNERKTNE